MRVAPGDGRTSTEQSVLLATRFGTLSLTLSLSLCSRLPKLEVTVDDEGEHDVDIVDDVVDAQRLDPAAIPLCVTLCQVRPTVLQCPPA